MEKPLEANVYTDKETRNDVLFWEKIETPDGEKLTCLGWMKREHFSDHMIDHCRDYLQYMWCADGESDIGDLDMVRARLRFDQKERGLH